MKYISLGKQNFVLIQGLKSKNKIEELKLF